jgi:cytidyltransferase-like protein
MSSESPRPTNEKVVSFDNLIKTVQLKKGEGKKVGLITGGFDVMHLGHTRLFRFAKENVDVLVVGIEQDQTLTLSKGQGRPINNLADRSEFLSELDSVDYVFTIPFVFQYGALEKADELYAEMYSQLQPDFLISNTVTDRFWELKKKRAEGMGMGFLGQGNRENTSSTLIADKIRGEI